MLRKYILKSMLAGSVCALALAGAAAAQTRDFDVPAGDLQAALDRYAQQADVQLLYKVDLVRGVSTRGARGALPADDALNMLLAGTGLEVRRHPSGAIAIVQAGEGGSSPQDASAGGDVEALIVTAQKREEAIQDVPIAISAFSQKALEDQKIEGGFDLLKAIPNVTFSKSNFTSYNFSIRGVGTKAISATTDPGVAVAFNNTTLIQNRLFEQEYFDVERVEVLRGPQGTLYGRNATSGVINVISAKPDLGEFEGSVKLEVGNYDSRRAVAMLNLPIVQDVLAVRLAGAMTQRTGYDYNELTKNNVNGRDLWSGRVTVGFEPIPQLRANLVWEHFEEDDDRSRTSKQLCHYDPGLERVGSSLVARPGSVNPTMRRALVSQSCKPGSLYDDAAFGVPNGLALPFVFPWATGVGLNRGIGYDPVTLQPVDLFIPRDPYGGMMQSRDLRTIASSVDPRYTAKADLYELSVDFDITDSLTFTSQTVYNEDQVFSFQDYNRFNSFPVFNDSTGLVAGSSGAAATTPSEFANLTPGGFFCDPQVGCSDRVAGFDVSQANGKQFSQEFRLASDFDGSLNFSAGVNYTRFKTVADYYVFYNLITLLGLRSVLNGSSDLGTCSQTTYILNLLTPVPIDDPTARCPYIDPNPITENFDGDGHNYFRSKNPYRLKSTAAFGELYWNAREDLKLTVGLRYTKDEKTFIPVPSQLLLSPSNSGGGVVTRGYPEDDPIVQKWGEWTGRLGLDWKTQLPFTDETMLYGFYSRGYKGGGANPPSPGFATDEETFEISAGVFTTAPLFLKAVEYGQTFEPEFVDAIELGAKNTLLDGRMTFNATGFYYDYKDYQVSQIRDRTAVNENFDAKVWGLEFEAVFAPSRDFRLNWNLGYLDTEIADGESSIDIMNRTQGDPNYVLFRPWAQLPSNCVLPAAVVERYFNTNNGVQAYLSVCGGVQLPHPVTLFDVPPIDPNPAFGGGAQAYNVDNYPELNGGAGLRDDVGGNELPNAPHWTTNLGAEYGRDILDGSWRVTMRGDAYWQSQSWARVYNAVNDKLHGWYNLNASIRLENRELGLQAEFYVKNLLDKSPITDAFINSDDSGLTTNVFVLDPRLVGFNVRKTF